MVSDIYFTRSQILTTIRALCVGNDVSQAVPLTFAVYPSKILSYPGPTPGADQLQYDVHAPLAFPTPIRDHQYGCGVSMPSRSSASSAYTGGLLMLRQRTDFCLDGLMRFGWGGAYQAW